MDVTARVLRLVALLSAGTACASSVRTMAGAARPRLHAVAPDSVDILAGNVTQVDLRGSGFDTSRAAPENTVHVGTLVLRALPSDARGTVIHVVIPPVVTGNGEAPPAPWLSGRYPVSVSTRLGTSDTVMLTIASRGRGP